MPAETTPKLPNASPFCSRSRGLQFAPSDSAVSDDGSEAMTMTISLTSDIVIK
ncbi:hypothetical protein M404DRAFT_994852 [Pisolithus tinctorius Marx 270]|uniref:Uncharacterized protein n=1 Tax=Pisolithus tinctorius Marx 270 TaxID=870435 RepID=A0A0C3PQC8_PISTI|nr:hypothetical protein M404DRAFT_994852 [Pisolithus tinctorius Marx 270]